jgi:hypothetical protein
MLRKSILLLLCIPLLTGCHIPLFPSHIRLEKCNRTPPDRLFNSDSFTSKGSRSELIIIRDAGYYGADFALPVAIDSVRFADIQIWEMATAYLEPGSHKIEFTEPPGTISIGKQHPTFLQIVIPKEGKTILRIDLGRKYPAIRQVEN